MNDELPKTWQELKERMESKRSNMPNDLNVTCLCGKHIDNVELSDSDYKELFEILNG